MFDGVCHFCNNSVQFIIKHDKKAIFSFASLQSEVGKKLLENYSIPTNIDSLIFIDGDTYYTMSEAALRICKELNGFWRFGYLFLVVPKGIRDSIYRIIARNRYKWFGKNETCPVPTPAIRKRFL